MVLGIAYKKDVDDQRESPSLKIISLLKDRGAFVDYNDPYVMRSSGHRDYPGLKMKSVGLTEKKLRSYDAVVIATDHSDYDYSWIVKNSFLVIDTRNAVKQKRKKVIKA
jgi:UDP-N-acetyl-D-glucosamine dehydrogenase